MKYLLIICIFLGLLLQNFSQSFIVMQFRRNQDYIAKVLCENKSKPEMHCDGKCYLKKELDRNTQQEKNTNSGKERFEVMFVEDLHSFLTAPAADQVSFTVFYRDPFLDTPVHSIFHPPQA